MRNKLLQQIVDETPKETEIFVEKYAALMVRIEDILTKKDWSQKDLAENMGQKPSAISRWLNGKGNLTLKSIAKLEAELGETLIEIPTGTIQETEWQDSEVVFKVSKRKTKRTSESFNDVEFKPFPLKPVA